MKGWLEALPKYKLQVSGSHMELRNVPLQVQNISLKGQRGEAGSCFTPEVHTVFSAVIGCYVWFSPGLWGKGCMRVSLGQLACPTERVEQGAHSLQLGLHSVKDA